jgi:hypothetical protein
MSNGELDIARSGDPHRRLTEPRLVMAPPATYLALPVRADLGSDRFRRAAGKLQAAAREARRRARDAGVTFRPGRIECLATAQGDGGCEATTLLVRLPDELSRSEAAVQAWSSPAARLSLVRIEGGLCVQAAAVATAAHWSYTLRRMADAARLEGLMVDGPLHIAFLGDPRRSTPGTPATVIVRQAVQPGVLLARERVERIPESLRRDFASIG